VARLHRGDITAAASPGGGARFEVTIPLSDEGTLIDTSCRIA
jgi:signal transduction histidine kinase